MDPFVFALVRRTEQRRFHRQPGLSDFTKVRCISFILFSFYFLFILFSFYFLLFSFIPLYSSQRARCVGHAPFPALITWGRLGTQYFFTLAKNESKSKLKKRIPCRVERMTLIIYIYIIYIYVIFL